MRHLLDHWRERPRIKLAITGALLLSLRKQQEALFCKGQLRGR